jgi:hypothetical protein
MKTTTRTPPVSKTLQQLLAQIQAEAVAATLEALSQKDGTVSLNEVDVQSIESSVLLDGDVIYWRDHCGYSLRISRTRFEPENWKGAIYMSGKWRPGQWRVTETRLDDQGREWECYLGPHIVDDFGTLVPVEGGAA